MTFAALLRGGLVADGSGSEPVPGDVGICGDRIAATGDLSAATASRVFDLTGRIVCPGFIDTHSHSDAYVLADPAAPSKVFQGVTTEVVGQCGISAAPVWGNARLPTDWERQSFPGSWKTVAEYRTRVDEARPMANVVLLIGHNLIRAGVMGYVNRPASPEDLRTMEFRLEQALEEGGRGLSTGLVYPPGQFSQPSEIAALARIAARRDGVYATHMRSEGAGLLAALEETLAVGRAADVTVVISHLKTSGRAAWPLLPAALDLIESARREGLRVVADRYPYTAGCTDLDILLPGWAKEGTRQDILDRLGNPEIRDRIRLEILESHPDANWSEVWVGSTDHPQYLGRPLPEVAADMRTTPVDAALDLILMDRLSTGGIFFGMSEDNLRGILSRPWVMIGSDASLRSLTGPLRFDHPHPRAYGTFPRLLREALDGRSVLIGEMIRKMTALPASVFGLRDRGLIAAGAVADLAVFDPLRIRDRATYGSPHQLAEGVEQVWVNGVAELLDGRTTGNRGGRFLADA